MEWRRTPRALGRFVLWLRYYDAGRTGPPDLSGGRGASGGPMRPCAPNELMKALCRCERGWADIAALEDQVQALRQETLDLRHRGEEREEELAAPGKPTGG